MKRLILFIFGKIQNMKEKKKKKKNYHKNNLIKNFLK